MSKGTEHKRLETRSIVVGYAMSRLDLQYLKARGLSSWNEAYSEASRALGQVPATFKNLRDEFDPIHSNPRKGWHKRSLRPTRQNVLSELAEVGEDAILELASRLLAGDKVETAEAIDSLARISNVSANVAERLLTGRRAEEFFLANCQSIISIGKEDIIDLRNAAAGFDFGVRRRPKDAIEVKGIKEGRGNVLFTDREWSEAKARKRQYALVVVGNLATSPTAMVIHDPFGSLSAHCQHRQVITATWTAKVAVV